MLGAPLSFREGGAVGKNVIELKREKEGGTKSLNPKVLSPRCRPREKKTIRIDRGRGTGEPNQREKCAEGKRLTTSASENRLKIMNKDQNKWTGREGGGRIHGRTEPESQTGSIVAALYLAVVEARGETR